MQKKIALLYSQGNADWKSVGEITLNLRKSYKKLKHFYNINDFNYKYKITTNEILELSKKILKFNPDTIVFLDHNPNPLHFLRLLNLEDYKFSPEIIVHIYGNFSHFSNEWADMREIASLFKIKFICASRAQQRFFSHFLTQKNINFLCPFPVDEKYYNISLKARNNFRKKYKISDDTFVLAFTGRLSLQKNITLLNHEIENYLKKYPNQKLKLFYAGPFDDLGAPFHNIYQKTGHQFYLWKKSLENLKDKNIITWIGNLDRSGLHKLYNGADCYISFGTHHDEDYGMAPREALLCGCPSILTSWGGFEEFKDFKHSKIIKISLERDQIFINSKQFPMALNRMIKKRPTETAKKKISTDSIKRYSPSNCSKIINKIINAPLYKFKGFNWKITELKKITQSSEYGAIDSPRYGAHTNFYQNYI